jgi:opacity protein-like surface antigen
MQVFSQKRHKGMFAKSATLIAVSSILAVAAAQAADVTSQKMVLTAYSNGSGGESLMSGKYADAFKEMEKDRTSSSSAYTAKLNNLCVAYAATKQLTEAKSMCTAALKSAKYDRISSQRYSPGSLRENSYVAIAYTNRAVVHMLTKNTAGANEDLARAKALAPTADFVAKNLAAVQGSRSTIAQLEIAPSR